MQKIFTLIATAMFCCMSSGTASHAEGLFNGAQMPLSFFETSQELTGHIVGQTHVAGFYMPGDSDANLFAYLTSPATFLYATNQPVCLWGMAEAIKDGWTIVMCDDQGIGWVVRALPSAWTPTAH